MKLIGGQVRAALIGCGNWGPKVARAATATGLAELVAVADVCTDRAEAVRAGHPGAVCHTDVATVLRDPTIEAVFVATPPHTHHAVAGAALRAGKHVLVEKPLATRVADCVALKNLADGAKLVLAVGHVFLHAAAVKHVSRLIADGVVGEIVHAIAERMNWGMVRDDVDVFWSLAPHDVSILNHWLGAHPSTVVARAVHVRQGSVADSGTAMLQYGAASAEIRVNWLHPVKTRRVTLVGRRATVVYDDTRDDNVVVYHHPDDLREHPGEERIRVGGEQPLIRECRDFLTSVRSGARPLVVADDGIAVAMVLEAMTESAAHGGKSVQVAGAAPPQTGRMRPRFSV